MSPVLRTGWELDDPNKSSSVIKSTVQEPQGGKIEIVGNISNGNFDVYNTQLIGRPSQPIFSYNAATDKIIPKDVNSFNSLYKGRTQLDQLVKSTKVAIFDNAQLNTGTDPVNNQYFNNIKNSSGYKSIANATPPGQRAPGAVPGGNSGGDSATQQGATSLSKEDQNTLEKASENYIGRTDYPYPKPLKYPKDLKLNDQDCIQFTIIKYVPRGLGLSNPVPLSRTKDVKKGDAQYLTTITLPIPGGISDRNSVSWQEDRLNPFLDAFGNTLNQFFMGGAEAAGPTAKKEVDALKGSDPQILKTFASVKATEAALGTSNLLARQYGAAVNPNIELLFSSPQLREFTFTFRMSPRSSEEAKTVRTIIRYFKQAMSVKRSPSVLLLKTPHTFRIKYLTSNQDHPYLNKFKECALTSCSVNYAPEGTYMSYNGEPSMVVYELTLTFQELEPIFDDDYDTEEQRNTIPTNIGY